MGLPGFRGIFKSLGGSSAPPTYLSLAGITDPTEISAINTLISTLQGGTNIWARLDRVFPFSPTSLTAASYCCKSLTRLTWVNAPTHGSTGVAFNGSSQYALTAEGTDTLANFSVTSSANIYLTAVGSLSGSQMAFGQGGIDPGDFTADVYLRQNTTSIVTIVRGTTQAIQTTTSIVPANYCISRLAGNDLKSYKNGVQASSQTSIAGQRTLPISQLMGIGCFWFSGAPFAASYFPETVAFFTLGAAFNSTDQLTLYNAIQAYQTSLGRSV